MPLLATGPESTTDIRPTVAGSRLFDRLSLVLFLVVAILILATFRDYGITWDEPENDHYGYLIAKYYESLLHGKYDPAAATIQGISIYGGLFNLLQSVAIVVSPFGPYETRHLVNALAGLLGIIGCWKLGRHLAGPAAGFWAALLLTLTPRFYGAMFNNPKDIPSAVAYIWSIYYLTVAWKHLPRLPLSVVLKLGAAIGCALAIRTGAFLLLFYMVLIWAGYFVFDVRTKGWSSGSRHNAFAMAKSLVAIVAISWTMMLMFWPWAQLAPFTRPFESASTFMHYPWDHRLLDKGILIRSLDVPRTYITRWLFMTTPDLTLLLLGAGVVACIVILWKHREWLKTGPSATYAIVAFSVLFPIAVALTTRPILYDAERHFTYVVPPAVCLAGAVLASVELLNRRTRIAVYALAGAGFLYQGLTMFRLHPDEYVYFNQMSGGLRGAEHRYDTDYWGNSYREAIQRLAKYIEASDLHNGNNVPYSVMPFSERLQSTYYFSKTMKYVTRPEQADFIVSITRARMDESIDGQTILTVSRMGVPLAVVKDRRQLKGIAAPAGWYNKP